MIIPSLVFKSECMLYKQWTLSKFDVRVIHQCSKRDWVCVESVRAWGNHQIESIADFHCSSLWGVWLTAHDLDVSQTTFCGINTSYRSTPANQADGSKVGMVGQTLGNPLLVKQGTVHHHMDITTALWTPNSRLQSSAAVQTWRP